MSNDQDKKKTERKQQQAPTKEKQKIKSTELTDADLDKVAGGLQFNLPVPDVFSTFNPKEIQIDKSVPWQTVKGGGGKPR